VKRILLDQGLGPRAATILRQHGWDAVHVSEIGMARAEDIQILERARSALVAQPADTLVGRLDWPKADQNAGRT
jgi:predicted nuclease of predicted toxin-antitoxin system